MFAPVLRQLPQDIPDLLNATGVKFVFCGIVTLVFLGLLAKIPYIAWGERWAQKYWHILCELFGFKKMKPPVDTTISRALAECSLVRASFLLVKLAILRKTNMC